MSVAFEKVIKTLRCARCRSELSASAGNSKGSGTVVLACAGCKEEFPIINGIPRMLLSPFREALLSNGQATGRDALQVATAQSFGFEWRRFPEMYDEWEASFLAYMQPRGPEFFRGKKVLDAGCGGGRFAHYAARYGAEVWAVDLGPAVEVATRTTENAGELAVVQADVHALPFAPESFDFI